MCLMMLSALNLHPQGGRAREAHHLRGVNMKVSFNMSMDNILKSPTMINALMTESSLRDPCTLQAHHQLICSYSSSYSEAKGRAMRAK